MGSGGNPADGCAPTDPMCIQAQRAEWSQKPIFSCRMRDRLYNQKWYVHLLERIKRKHTWNIYFFFFFFKENS